MSLLTEKCSAQISPAAPAPEALAARTMSGQNIICFAKDWSGHPTSNNHVMLEFAKRNKVLWLNSISTRSPSLTSGSDIKKIFRKLASFFKGVRREKDGLWIYTPIVLPFPHSRWAAAMNRHIMKLTLKILKKRIGMDQFQVWSFIPSTADYVGDIGASVCVYYCVDEWSKFSYVDETKLAEKENRLTKMADVVFATSASLVQTRGKINPQTILARHGVEYELFRTALDESTQIPADIAHITQPILGVYGTIQDWVDIDLLHWLAERNPQWAMVIIGRSYVDLSALEKLKNVYVLGKRPHEDLPGYCKAFAVGMIAQRVNELTIHMNPIKMREYLSAGLPVVATAMPEVKAYAQWCAVTEDRESFEKACAAAIASDTPQLRRQRSDSMRNESWRNKVADLSEVVMRIQNLKQGHQPIDSARHGNS